jgi:endonuclease/exonuclease/phosphatase family metal-dependent hydrolase
MTAPNFDDALKVLTLNIHKGLDAFGVESTLRRLKEALRDSGADVAFLQEVVGRDDAKDASGVGPTQSQFEFLADEVWPHYAYGRNALFPKRHHGVAVLSKFPITSRRHEDVSTNRFERRGALHCTIAAPMFKRPTHLLCVHFGLTQRGRTAQTEKVVRYVADNVPKAAPLIVAGDFNDWLRKASRPLRLGAGLIEAHEALHRAPARTFPAALPILAVDRIYVRNVEPIAARVLSGARWRRLSDHAPVAAVLGRVRA